MARARSLLPRDAASRSSSFIDRQDVVGDDGGQCRVTWPPDELAAYDATDQNVERLLARLLAVVEMLAYHHAVRAQPR
jgi:hypothetical protein